MSLVKFPQAGRAKSGHASRVRRSNRRRSAASSSSRTGGCSRPLTTLASFNGTNGALPNGA